MKTNIYKVLVSAFLVCSLLSGCKKADIPVIDDFDKNKYLGTWYEIARLDNSFERNLELVTANYSVESDGKIKVVNRGYNTVTKKWEDAHANAESTDVPNFIKVYFVPFIAGDYKVAYIDDDYTIAVVSGGTFKYLWFLSRTPKVTEEQMQRMISVSQIIGYDTSKLIYTVQQ